VVKRKASRKRPNEVKKSTEKRTPQRREGVSERKAQESALKKIKRAKQGREVPGGKRRKKSDRDLHKGTNSSSD